MLVIFQGILPAPLSNALMALTLTCASEHSGGA